jgi:hypothetical protein
MERLLCRDKLRKLLQTILREPAPQRVAAIVQRETFPPRMPLSYAFGERLAQVYYATLNVLAKELVPQHTSSRDLVRALWELCGEIASNPTTYQARGELRRRLNTFVRELKKPLKLYQVVYKLDNLALGNGRFSLGDVQFFTMTDEELIRWGVSREQPLLSNLFNEFSNHPVATVEVSAADNARAFETGLEQTLIGLDLLRLAAVRARISRLDDEMFLWRLNGEWLAKQIEPLSPYPTQGWRRTMRPLLIDMTEHIRQGLVPEYSSLQAIANAELPVEIHNHITRAIRWMSNSVTREQLDDKVVGLCTALEIMLLPGYEGGWKGQIIDLRHRLLGGNWEPGGILQLYELRSKIVHGGALNVSRYLDYWYLLVMCFEALQRLTKLAERNPQAQTLEDLIGIIETEERLQNFIHQFQMGIFRGKQANKVKQAAKRRLKDLQEI